jgi:hypothetical protein
MVVCVCVCGGGWVLLGSFSAGKFQKKTHRPLWGNYTPEMPYKGNKKKGIFSSVFLLAFLDLSPHGELKTPPKASLKHLRKHL